MQLFLTKLFFLFLLTSFNYCYNSEKTIVSGYDPKYYSHIDIETWNYLAEYFPSENSQAKIFLDEAFQSFKFNENEKTLEKAGFKGQIKPGVTSKNSVVSHPLLPDYVLKLFLEVVQEEHEEYYFLKRIVGSKLIQDYIEKNNLNLFVVPKKWIYPILLFSDSFPNQGNRQKFLLFAEKIDLYSWDENYSLWKTSMTSETIKQLFQIVHDLGLWDSMIPGNTCFTHDGHLAFIDTEHYKVNVEYNRLNPYISKKMWLLWTYLHLRNRSQLYTQTVHEAIEYKPIDIFIKTENK